MNLGIATVVRMLKGAPKLPVEVAADAAAQKLLAELARSAGRTVARASAGLFLTPPVVQPGMEQRAVPAVPAAPAVPAGPKPRRTRGNGKVKPRAVRKYPALSTTFLQGSLSGQIKAVFKSRETNPQKVTDFKLALANGDCTWDLLPLSTSELASAFICAEFGINKEVRHASYIAHWIELLKHDDRAFFTAASKAQKAADYLRGIALAEPVSELAPIEGA
jgi:Zincin-like metallopeptidase